MQLRVPETKDLQNLQTPPGAEDQGTFLVCCLCFASRQTALFTAFLTGSWAALVQESTRTTIPLYRSSSVTLSILQPLLPVLCSPGPLGCSQGSGASISVLIYWGLLGQCFNSWENFKRYIQITRDLKSLLEPSTVFLCFIPGGSA